MPDWFIRLYQSLTIQIECNIMDLRQLLYKLCSPSKRKFNIVLVKNGENVSCKEKKRDGLNKLQDRLSIHIAYAML